MRLKIHTEIPPSGRISHAFSDHRIFILLVRTVAFSQKIIFNSSYIEKHNYFLLYELIQDLPYGYMKGELSVTQQQGLITCIPKDSKPKQFLKNWPPLTLLDTVYKIASGTIANRMKTTLDHIINKDQTGFIKG